MSIKGNLDQIKDILLSEKSYLKEEYFINNIGLFGSYTRGEQKNKSDLDILVEFSKPIDFFLFLDLEAELSEKLGVKVDLVTKPALKPHIKEHILSELVEVK